MGELEAVAAEADIAADEQRKVARSARRMQRARDRGEHWSSIVEREDAATLVELLRGSARRVRTASTALISLLARGLAIEGESRRRIARRLGVTHQRVTALLHGPASPSSSGEHE